MRPSRVTIAFMWLAAGCGGGEPLPGGGSGGYGGADGSGGTASTIDETVSTVGTTALQTTTSAPAPACGLPEPAGCTYPDPFKGYHPDALQEGGLGPAPGRDGTTASASCLAPMSAGDVLLRAVVGFNGEPPLELPIDAWAQAGEHPGERVPAPLLATLETVESGPGGLTSGVYLLPQPVTGAGLVPCIGTMVGDYQPPTMIPADECYQPARAWWYGLPATNAEMWTWAMLDCPEDPSILSYRREFPYELRP